MSRDTFTFKRFGHHDPAYTVYRGKRQTRCGVVWAFEPREWYGQTGQYQTGRRSTRLAVAKALNEMTPRQTIRS